MSHERTVDQSVARFCHAASFHAPWYHVVHQHHVVPVSWGGERGRTVDLCPTCHYNVHALIDEYVRDGGEPPWELRRRFGPNVREYASLAWVGRPSDKPPLTLDRA